MSDEPEPDQKRPEQFSLRALLLAVAVIAVAFSAISSAEVWVSPEMFLRYGVPVGGLSIGVFLMVFFSVRYRQSCQKSQDTTEADAGFFGSFLCATIFVLAGFFSLLPWSFWLQPLWVILPIGILTFVCLGLLSLPLRAVLKGSARRR